MKTFRNNWSLRVLALAVAAVMARPVLVGAQVGPITNGHALDANPEVGSGGSNSPVPGYVPINPNAIVSGNVSGLGYFHGQNNTIAQYETQDMGNLSTYSMQAPLGTSTLYRFARQSSGAPVENNYQTDYTPYFLPSATVTGQDVLGSPVSAMPVNGGFSSNFVPPAAISSASRFAPAYGNIGAGTPAQNAGVPYREYNALTNGAVTAPYALPTARISELYGLRNVPATQRVANFNILNGKSPTPPVPAKPAPTARGEQGTLSAGSQPVNGGIRFGGKHQIGAKGTTGRVTALARGGQSVRAITNGDLYGNLLNRLAARQKRALAYDRARFNGGLQTFAPGQRRPINHGGAGALAQGGGSVNVLPAGKFTQPGHGARGGIASAAPQRGEHGNQALQKQRMTTMLQSARTVRSLSRLYGNTPTPFNQLMRQAQLLMRRGKYLRAAGAYQGAITINPTNALGIVGRANAQLAAGLYESAAYDLKFLFNRHPQLTAVRYKLRKFLPARRIRFLKKDLGKLAAQQKHSNAGIFLLSYLDYQVHDTAGLRHALAAWKKRQPRSYWPVVLKTAWLMPVHHARAARPGAKVSPRHAVRGPAKAPQKPHRLINKTDLPPGRPGK